MIPNYGMYPQQQQRLNYLESQMATQQNLLRGRPVASLDEVRAIPIDFDGTIFYFPDVSNNRIYTKQIGLNGQAVFRMYELTDLPSTPQPTSTQDFVSKEEFNQAINDLSAQLTQIKQGGGTVNDKQQQQPTKPIF